LELVMKQSTRALSSVPFMVALASLAAFVLVACGGGGGDGGGGGNDPPAPSVSRGPTSSGPIQISPDDKTVWVANPDTNTVALLDVNGDRKGPPLAEPAVGEKPRNLAISPDGKKVFVANSGENTVTVLSTASPYPKLATVTVGVEPYGLAFTPNGRKLYVANAASNTVSVIDPTTHNVVKTIDDVGPEPRGVAVTNDGDDRDDDEKLYVTQFFGVDRQGVKDGTILIGADDYKEGRVAVISTANDTLVKQAVLEPMADTGFKSNGSSLKKIPAKKGPNGEDLAFEVTTGAFPNMLQSVVIKGARAYLPNTCASPDGPVRFNVNMQSCLSVLDTTTDAEGQAGGASQTINMNRGINFEVADENNEFKRLFLAVPWAVAFKNQSNEGYAVSLSSNVIVKVQLDAAGTPTINAPKAAGDPGAIVRILVGQGPRGIVINSTDTRAYVANENSRDVSVVDLGSEKELHRLRSAALPQPGTQEARALIGKAISDSSTGVDLPELSSPQLSGVVRRFPATLSNEGWGSCFACHGFTRTDNVVWSFGSGPRRSSSLHWTYNPQQVDALLKGQLALNDADIKLLNHSAINNDVQDFQNNILDVSGGSEAKSQDAGLILGADGKTAGGPNAAGLFDGAGAGGSKAPLAKDNRNRSPQLDALAFYIATGIQQPRSPFSFEPLKTQAKAQIDAGRQLFADANCASCHGGEGWASGRFSTVKPPFGTIVQDAGVAVTTDVLRDVGTFFVAAPNEVKQNGTTAAGALGYNPPSLLGAFNLGPYLHNGSAFTLEDVMALKPHRTSGLPKGAPDPFDSAKSVADIVAFVRSIDASTAPFAITALPSAAAAQFAGGPRRVPICTHGAFDCQPLLPSQ
jgi:YVTN family beta-propeller protein